ncbi:MAG TPA: hypothetical protein VLB73_02480 [Patescibacteria group bacterium]|nr:hypothetical protein [Patescibacteria group bacterium]
MSRRQVKDQPGVTKEGVKQHETQPWGIKDHGERPTGHLAVPQQGTKVPPTKRLESL